LNDKREHLLVREMKEKARKRAKEIKPPATTECPVCGGDFIKGTWCRDCGHTLGAER